MSETAIGRSVAAAYQVIAASHAWRPSERLALLAVAAHHEQTGAPITYRQLLALTGMGDHPDGIKDLRLAISNLATARLLDVRNGSERRIILSVQEALSLDTRISPAPELLGG